MSEATAHLLLALATHRPVQDRLVAGEEEPGFLDGVVNETLQHFPLFGVAHRITSGEIPRAGQDPIPAGSVLLFNYPEYQGSGGDHFDPDRWLRPDTRPTAFIPFGVTANRPCPARGFAVLTMRVAAEEVLRRFRLESSVEHTRSLPSRGPCLLVARTGAAAPSGTRLTRRCASPTAGPRSPQPHPARPRQLHGVGRPAPGPVPELLRRLARRLRHLRHRWPLRGTGP